MKRWTWLSARILIALAGVAFILATLTWGDRVLLPAGWPIAEGVRLSEPTSAVVESARLTRRSQPVGDMVLTVELDDQEHTLALSATHLGTSDDRPRFKPGVLTTLRAADYLLIAVGVLLVGGIYPIQAYRWLILLRCRGYRVGFWRALRLTMVGQFFNVCMPGMTGGDVAKAWYAAKDSPAHVGRAAAVMSVVFDRVAGMIGLVLLSALIGLTLLEHTVVRRITLGTWTTLAIVVLLATMYFSRTVRRRIRFDRWYGWLPAPIRSGLHRVDVAAIAYSNHKAPVIAATLLSVPIHLLVALAAALAGYAVGMQQPVAVLLTVVPMLLLAGSLPVSYQGVGVMEALAYATLLQPGLATANQIVAMLLVLRLQIIATSLVGAVDLVRGDVHLRPALEDLADEELTTAPHP